MKTFITYLVAMLLVAGVPASAQPIRLTIWEAYRLAREHYPSSLCVILQHLGRAKL